MNPTSTTSSLCSNSPHLCIQLPQELSKRKAEQLEKERTLHHHFLSQLKSDVSHVSPKRSYCDLTAIVPPPTSIHSNSWIQDPNDSTKRIYSFLKICGSPYLQAYKKDYPTHIDIFTKPFGDWTDEEQAGAATRLRQLNIPLEDDRIYKIYSLLKTHEQLLCQNDKVSYPALYEVTATYGESSFFTSSEISFDLEIHADNKAALIFRNNETTFIGRGASKAAWRTFELGNLEVRAHTFSLPHLKSAIYAHQEESCFKKFRDRSWIAKVYNIYYYNVVLDQECFEEQVIEMKYYLNDFFTILMTHVVNIQNRISYAIQIMEAINDLNNQELIYRDLKPENFLVDENFWNLALTDFGLSCQLSSDELKFEVGTPYYMAPEILEQKGNYQYPVDIWSAGCLLWIILRGATYPWYNDVGNRAFSAAIKKMEIFENETVDLNNTADSEVSVKFLIWNMLRFNPADRWNATTVLNYLKNYQESLQRKIA